MVEHHEVVVVGGGQAGLVMSWHLRQRGVDHVVLERAPVGRCSMPAVRRTRCGA
jgi:putative flavoprotein involved in K+ transport